MIAKFHFTPYNSFMKKNQNKFNDSSYEIRLKAPLLKTVLILSGVLLIPVTANALVTEQFGFVISLILMFVLLAYAFLLLGRGHYNRSATLFIYSLNGLVVINGLMNHYTGEQTFAVYSGVICLVVISALLFAVKGRDLNLVIILSGAVFILRIALTFLKHDFSESSVTISQQLTLPSVIYTLVSVLAVLVRQIMDKVIKEAQDKIAQSQNQSLQMRELAQEASERLMLAQSMEKQAEETFVSVQDIDVQIQEIMRNLGILDEKYHVSLESLTLIGEKIGSLDNVAEKQSQNIQETTTALEEMVASIRSVSDIIGNKMDSVTQLRQRAEEGVHNIGTTTKSFAQVLENLDSIKQMITLISGIASKTNLLAMNAAIEAAHAGDAGRGFAVVADEVRKLAENSASRAKQVSDTLKQLIRSIEETGMNVNNSGESFKSISQEVDMVGMAMNEIDASIKELSIGSHEIIKASVSMNDLNSEVISAVKITREHETLTQKNVTSLGEFVRSLDDSMKRIDLGTDQIHIAVKDLKGKTGAINTFVQQFALKLK